MLRGKPLTEKISTNDEYLVIAPIGIPAHDNVDRIKGLEHAIGLDDNCIIISNDFTWFNHACITWRDCQDFFREAMTICVLMIVYQHTKGFDGEMPSNLKSWWLSINRWRLSLLLQSSGIIISTRFKVQRWVRTCTLKKCRSLNLSEQFDSLFLPKKSIRMLILSYASLCSPRKRKNKSMSAAINKGIPIHLNFGGNFKYCLVIPISCSGTLLFSSG